MEGFGSGSYGEVGRGSRWWWSCGGSGHLDRWCWCRRRQEEMIVTVLAVDSSGVVGGGGSDPGKIGSAPRSNCGPK